MHREEEGRDLVHELGARVSGLAAWHVITENARLWHVGRDRWGDALPPPYSVLCQGYVPEHLRCNGKRGMGGHLRCECPCHEGDE